MADIVFAGQATNGALNAGALPTNQDLVGYRGDYIELLVTLRDANGNAISLTGQTPKAQLKTDYDDPFPRDFACTLPGPTGQVRIFLSSAVTKDLLPGSYIWDFQITNGSGETRTYLAGDVIIYNEVTT